MNRNKLVSLLGLTATSALVLAACGGGSDGDTASTESSTAGSSSEEQVLNIIESAELPNMDSAKSTDVVSGTVLNNVNEGLYRQNPDNELELAMAAEEPEVSEDGLTYTFKIREDAVWSNGDPVTADDFIYAWARLATPETAAEYSYMIDGVVKNASAILTGEMEPSELGATAVDDKTLEVQLEKAVPYFKDLLTLPMFLPQNEAFVTEQGDKYATNSDTVLYNGPFVLDEWDGTGLSWVLNKNEDYWDKDTVVLDTINVDVVKETSTAINLYDTGAVDRITLSGEYVQTKQGDPELKTQPTSSVFYFKFNQERNGEETPLANENIRKAIAMSFDKQAFADTVLQNGSIPANGLVPAELASDPASGEDFREQSGDLLTFDVEQAQEYFKKGLEELGVDSINLEILGDDTENAKKSLEFMQAQLTSNLPGLEISLRNVPFKVRLDADTKQDYDIEMAGWGADYGDPINFLELFHSENGNNKSSYSNADYDALVESAQTNVTDLEGRWEDMLEAEKILMETGGIAPIYQRAYSVLEKDYLKDYTSHLTGAEYSYKWASIEGKE
ncbi:MULTISPECIES: peptide ABC transporter substrate-binding protein [Carnobacterium]|uniref:Peptide ABC transporter substrate-binding protein n=1 Tax=Carnobacterium inhibens subsp. gilichinskyi TaxID=1266845 RepID=U5S7X0_9LACT|nr:MULTISPECIES: peptide ABC transporter substrate-binding protein [Carnobacterium]AGY81325.1 peptide ABC transporter substrate-binding protein [Carnobacterium inhibens subsp. gilichinskyi]MCM3512929.1 peptide ABC transporter substrate-binding protein [Carnobacterium inhibens]MDN5371093.1 oligopeptide transport system substrate-binding protein [Carnobacterium sp.]